MPPTFHPLLEIARYVPVVDGSLKMDLLSVRVVQTYSGIQSGGSEVNEERFTGAYRHHFRSRSDLSRQTKFRYESCDSCRGIFQSMEVEGRMRGMGSYTTRYPTLDETIKFNRENERHRREFRSPTRRCTCDTAGDRSFFMAEPGSGEVGQRQQDLSRPDLPDEGWYSDPSSLYAMRFWNGASWTGFVSDGGAAVTTPIVVPNNWDHLLPGERVTSSENPVKPGSKRRIVKTTKNLADQLTELTKLYDAGALTKEQFEAAKNALLGL